LSIPERSPAKAEGGVRVLVLDYHYSYLSGSLIYESGGELDQIQFLLGHVSVQFLRSLRACVSQ
jgi:hypothetical protein